MRLPGLMFGLLGAVTTGLLGWRLFGRRTGLIAGILYATTILPTALSQAASHDVALIPWINLTLLLLWEGERATSRSATTASRRARGTVPFLLTQKLGQSLASTVAAGGLLGLAVLTKGLFGVAAVGVAFGGYVVIARRIRPAVLLQAAPWSARSPFSLPHPGTFGWTCSFQAICVTSF